MARFLIIVSLVCLITSSLALPVDSQSPDIPYIPPDFPPSHQFPFANRESLPETATPQVRKLCKQCPLLWNKYSKSWSCSWNLLPCCYCHGATCSVGISPCTWINSILERWNHRFKERRNGFRPNGIGGGWICQQYKRVEIPCFWKEKWPICWLEDGILKNIDSAIKNAPLLNDLRTKYSAILFIPCTYADKEKFYVIEGILLHRHCWWLFYASNSFVAPPNEGSGRISFPCNAIGTIPLTRQINNQTNKVSGKYHEFQVRRHAFPTPILLPQI